MINIQQLFSKSYKHWNDKEKQQVEEFFLCNRFFSKFYQNKKFQQVARICLYRKLQAGEKLILENNNRAQAIILLRGDVIVRKKQRILIKKPRIANHENQPKLERNQKKEKKHQIEEEFEYIFMTHLKEFNQTLTLNSQCSVEAPEDRKAEILFVPCALFYKLQEDMENQRVEKIEHVLEKYFFRLKKKQLHELSQSNCIFRQFKMNNYIYRASSKPEEIFILLQGIVKLQKSGFSQQTVKQNSLINPGMIFGEKDLKLQERARNAIACTAHVEVLTIPKASFLKFALKAFPDIVFDSQKLLSPNKLPKLDQNLRISHSLKISPNRNTLLPSIRKSYHFHQSSLHHQRKKSQSEEKREYELIRNSHMLVDMKQKKQKKFDLRSYSPRSKEELQEIIKKNKSKLKELKLSSKFSLDNSLLNL